MPIKRPEKLCNALTWHRDGNGWLLLAGRRRLGRVVPDNHPGMWRSLKSDGELSEPANLSWAKNAVLVAAELELDFERRAIDLPKSSEREKRFSARPALVRQNGLAS